MVIAHCDGDVLVYELGFAAEASWKYQHKERGEVAEGPPPFDYVADMMLKRIPQIVAESGADEEILYLTGKKNFRNHIAKTTPYKARIGNKPFHYKNIRAVMPTMFHCIEEEGLEADDLISLALVQNPNDIAVSRDKDIRQVPGNHYSWEMYNQPAIGPFEADTFGHIEIKKGKLFGYGDKFLYAQMVMGDSIDSIPGCPKYGPVKAMELLKDCQTQDECLNAIIPAFQKCYTLDWKTVLREQARLVHLARRFENGKILLWDFPGEDETWMDVISGETFPTSKGGDE